MPPIVVVGIDGSPNADAALAWALGYAAAVDARVRVVTAWGWEEVVGVPGARFPTETREEAERRARALQDDALERAGTSVEGIDIERHTGQVPAARVLLEAAADAALVVVGSRGMGGFRGLMLGSVSQQCVTHATCPTVVVPHEDTREGSK